MSRPRGPSGPGISLFPFLAVLLCTMGALLVVLVIFSRSSAEQASEADEAANAELEAARAALLARLDEFERQKRDASERLSQARLRLAGIEEHARGLQDEMTSIQASLSALVGKKSGPVDAAQDAELAARLAKARESLELAKAEAGTKPPAYAVVPYEGASGTRRRPLYIECCGDGVFLQPEGIRLKPSDFEGPPGPGNPLASALRAAREHLASRPDAAGTTESQPYPLLLVRPSGVMAYYAARESIGSWGSDFGYQLVDEDWQLAFPAADPMLADVETRAIEEARGRLQWLAEVRPKRPAKPATKYRASSTRGGVVSTEGPSVLGDQSRFEWNDADADRAARGDALGRSGRGSGGIGGPGGRDGAGGSGFATRTAPLDRSQAQSLVVGGGPGGGGGGVGGGGGGGGDGGAGRDGVGFGNDPRGGVDGRLGRGSGSLFPANNGAGVSTDGITSGTASGVPAGQGSEAGLPGGSSGRSPVSGVADGRGSGAADGGRPDGDVAANAGVTSARGDRTSGSRASSGVPPGGGSSFGSASAGDSGPSGAASGGVAMPGMLQPQAGQSAGGSQATASVSLANSRGSDWASLASRDRPIPLRRPIQIECAAHEFRIYDDANRRVVTRIPIEGDTATAIDPLVKAIHERVATWGIAGDRMFWKPQLFLSETPDGGGRRGDLERLMTDSGIDTFHRGSTVAPLPAVADSPSTTTRATFSGERNGR